MPGTAGTTIPGSNSINGTPIYYNEARDWRYQFLKNNVQPYATYTNSNDFLSSESVVLASGPPRISQTMPLELVPIGLVQNVQVSQQKQIQQLFEIGSRKPFFVPGRTLVSAGMSRILFDGPSLMYAMYLQTAVNNISPVQPVGFQDWSHLVGKNDADAPTLPDCRIGGAKYDAAGRVSNDFTPANAPLFKDRTRLDGEAVPGYFFINLASTFFNRAHGLGFLIYDMEQDAYGGFYLEDCYIQTHAFNVAAQQTVLVENVSVRASSLVPIPAHQIKLAGADGGKAVGCPPGYDGPQAGML